MLSVKNSNGLLVEPYLKLSLLQLYPAGEKNVNGSRKALEKLCKKELKT